MNDFRLTNKLILLIISMITVIGNKYSLILETEIPKAPSKEVKVDR